MLPLHRSPFVSGFRLMLVKAVCKFIQKDQTLADQAILVLLKYWPKVDPTKEISCLNELETILDNLKNIGPIVEIRHYIVAQVV